MNNLSILHGEDVIATRRARPRQRFLNSLRAAFDSGRLEDGVDHPAECRLVLSTNPRDFDSERDLGT